MKENPRIPNRRATTLVEVIVVMVLLTLVGGTAYHFFVQVQGNAQRTVGERLVLQMEARRIADELMQEVRKGTEIVRPHLGETTSFLICKDITNRMLTVYQTVDKTHSETFEKDLFRIVSYRNDYSGKFDPASQRILGDSVLRLTFTCLDPNSIQLNLILANKKQDFQFITRVGIMNLGNPQ